jgi:hypothetical protein
MLHFSYARIYAFNSTSITGLTLNTVNVTNNGDDSADVGIKVNNPWGSSTWTNTNVTQWELANVFIGNTSGTLTSLTITGGDYSDLGTAFGGNSLLFDIRGTAVTGGLNVNGLTIQDNKPARGITVQSQDTASLTGVTVQNNVMTDNGLHASFEQSGSANLQFQFINNGTALVPLTMPNTPTGTARALNVFSSSTTTGGSINGRITGNFIGNAAVTGSGSPTGNGLRVFIQGRTTSSMLVSNNTIRQTPQARGMDFQYVGSIPAGNPIAQQDLTVTGNSVIPTDSTGFPAGAIVISADNQGSPARVRANVTGNTVPSAPAVTGDYINAHLILANVAAGAELQLVDTTAPVTGTCATELAGTNAGTSGTTGACTLIAGPITTPP